MVETEYIKYQGKGVKKSEVPITVKWKNAPMVRIHSIRAAVREILNLSESLDVVKVNIVGAPSTGKTSLAETIQHLCHELGTIPYTVKTFTRSDLINFELTLSKLQPTNHILLFDDVSFLSASTGKRTIDKLQKAFTEIRHLQGGKDVKIITIFNFHYNMAVSKYLRQSDFFFYTSIGSSELENTQRVISNRYTQKILDFRKVYQEALTIKQFSFKLGKRGQKITYKFRKPFAPALFWNTDTARIVVFPLRRWIDPECPACANAKTKTEQEHMDITKFDSTAKMKYGIGVLRHALKIKLFNMGLNTFPKRVKQCMAFIDDYMMQNSVNLEELALHYNLRDNRTRLDFKPDEL